MKISSYSYLNNYFWVISIQVLILSALYWSGESINVTLWGTTSNQFDDETILVSDQPLVLVISSVTVKQFRGNDINISEFLLINILLFLFSSILNGSHNKLLLRFILSVINNCHTSIYESKYFWSCRLFELVKLYIFIKCLFNIFIYIVYK